MSMSTSLLYQAFGAQGYQYVSSEFADGNVYFTITQARDQLRCSQCGSVDTWAQGSIPRMFRGLPIGRKATFLCFDVPRVLCFGCGQVRQVRIRFAEPRRQYTRAFERYALELTQHMTIQAVAQHLRVGWDTIKDIQKRHLQKRFGRPKLRKLKEIAIDEVASGKGHRYLTLVMDLRSGAVVYVGEGKGVQALWEFWPQVRRARARIRAVATDLGRPYIRAVRDHLPGVIHVFDHFHVVKLFNEKLSALRRQLYLELTNAQERRLLKGTRWLLLKNPENLDPDRNELERLEEALALNTPLTIAYYLKEDLRQIWQQPNKATAWRVLRDWMRRARASGIAILQQFAETLSEHRKGILAYYDCRISTGPLEGTNNKIQTMKRQAYGFRDQEFFKLKILGIHETQYALVG
jgi:transposase